MKPLIPFVLLFSVIGGFFALGSSTAMACPSNEREVCSILGCVCVPKTGVDAQERRWCGDTYGYQYLYPWENCPTEFGGDGGGGSLSYFKVNVRNKCNEKIWVALRYQDNSDAWQTQSWWDIDPGETVYIQNTTNRHIYFYAVSDSYTWSGSHGVNLNGSTERFIPVNMGSKFVDYTHSFTCGL